MVRKLLTLLFVSVLAFPTLLVQSAAAQDPTKQDPRRCFNNLWRGGWDSIASSVTPIKRRRTKARRVQEPQ
jgi:hypothetical protein